MFSYLNYIGTQPQGISFSHIIIPLFIVKCCWCWYVAIAGKMQNNFRKQAAKGDGSRRFSSVCVQEAGVLGGPRDTHGMGHLVTLQRRNQKINAVS